MVRHLSWPLEFRNCSNVDIKYSLRQMALPPPSNLLRPPMASCYLFAVAGLPLSPITFDPLLEPLLHALPIRLLRR